MFSLLNKYIKQHLPIILILYIGAIILLVTLPLNSSSELNNISILQLRGDYFFHIVMFLPWAFFRSATQFKPFIWFSFGLLFAIGTESLQYFLPYRTFNINDLLANAMGVVFGAGIFLTFVRSRKKE